MISTRSRHSSAMLVLRMAAGLSPRVARMVRDMDEDEARIRRLADEMGRPKHYKQPKQRGVIPPSIARRSR